MDSVPRLQMRLPVGPGAAGTRPAGRTSLCDVLDGLLDTGIVVSGEIIVSVAGIDLLYVALELVACSWETAVGPGRVTAEGGRGRGARLAPAPRLSNRAGGGTGGGPGGRRRAAPKRRAAPPGAANPRPKGA